MFSSKSNIGGIPRQELEAHTLNIHYDYVTLTSDHLFN